MGDCRGEGWWCRVDRGTCDAAIVLAISNQGQMFERFAGLAVEPVPKEEKSGSSPWQQTRFGWAARSSRRTGACHRAHTTRAWFHSSHSAGAWRDPRGRYVQYSGTGVLSSHHSHDGQVARQDHWRTGEHPPQRHRGRGNPVSRDFPPPLLRSDLAVHSPPLLYRVPARRRRATTTSDISAVCCVPPLLTSRCCRVPVPSSVFGGCVNNVP